MLITKSDTNRTLFIYWIVYFVWFQSKTKLSLINFWFLPNYDQIKLSLNRTTWTSLVWLSKPFPSKQNVSPSNDFLM